MFRKESKNSKTTLEITENRLLDIHKSIRNSANIDMGDYTTYLKAGDWVEQDSGVYSSLCGLSSASETVLDVIFLEDSVLKKHKHPINIEQVFLISGDLEDTINGKKMREGDVYNIPKNTPHEFKSQCGCRCKVVFRPAM
jgi:mannose-6-phosphate isomerase-like protein (cupin superfamily)